MSTLTSVSSCQTTTCSFNQGGCTAAAITIGGHNDASCLTFVELDARGGLPGAHGAVGACQHLECTHNTDLQCTAESVEVGNTGTCLSYNRG